MPALRRNLLALLLVVGVGWSALAINVLETASPIGAQHLKLTFGIGLATSENGGVTSWHFTPQLRLALGVSDGMDLAVQSGILSAIGASDVELLGVIVDAKFTLADAPGMYAMAWGAGGGYGLDFLGEGWGVFGQFLFESHARLFPVYLVYRATLPIDSPDFSLIPHTALGVDFPLAPNTQLLMGVDLYLGKISIGLGLSIGF